MAPGAAGAPPSDAKGAAAKVDEAIKAAKAGNWWYFSSIVCLLVMFGLKAAGLLKKLGRWRYVILPVLSIAAALLAAFQGGVSVQSAVGVFATSWCMGMLEELVRHGIMGKPKSA
jgi:hypothetical protein